MVTSYRIGDITMIPRGNRWHCRFQIGKKRIPRTTREPLRNTAKAEARAKELYQTALLRSEGKEPCPTLASAFSQWETIHLLRKSRSHIENMARVGHLHLGTLAGVLLTDLTTALVEDEFNRFLATHAPSYGNQWLTYIRIVCKWAIRRGMIRALPFDVPEIKLKEQPKLLIPTHKAKDWLIEVDALTEHEPGIGMVLRLMIGLGLRGGEARHARWEWLDLERERYTPGDTKGGKAWARPVPPWVLEDLRGVAQPFGWMAPTMAGKLVTPGRVKRVFDAACAAVDIPHMVPHRLRATYATWLSEVGVPIQDIQAALEHKDIRTTAKYLGIDLDRIAQGQKQVAVRTGMAGRKSGSRVG